MISTDALDTTIKVENIEKPYGYNNWIFILESLSKRLHLSRDLF